MEKRRAHYPLLTVRQLIGEGRVRFTMTAAAGGAAMGFDTEDMFKLMVVEDLLIVSFKEKDR